MAPHRSACPIGVAEVDSGRLQTLRSSNAIRRDMSQAGVALAAGDYDASLAASLE